MSFLNPWAWVGLVAVLLPVAAHLFARRPARRQAFPTLRFLPASRLPPVRRHRVTDAGLLAIRCGVLAAAVTALAQPSCAIGPPPGMRPDAVARGILVDASASMRRESARGRSALDAARDEAASLALTASTSRVVETERPSELLASATEWLRAQPMRRELAVVSDFQAGSIERADIASVPVDIGLHLVRVPATGTVAAALETAPHSASVTLLAGRTERAAAGAAWQAATARGAPASAAAARPIAVVFPKYEQRQALIDGAKPLDQPWMFDALNAILDDPLAHLYADALTWTVHAMDRGPGLALLTSAAADSLGAAALLGAAARAASGRPSTLELSPDLVPETELRSWEREAVPVVATSSRRAGSLGRWIWVAVLALLLVEAVVRRARPGGPNEVQHERAA